MSAEDFVAGRRARRAFVTSVLYAAYDNALPPEEAMKLFLPPVSESLVQIARPLPQDRQDWIRGWEEERAEAEAVAE